LVFAKFFYVAKDHNLTRILRSEEIQEDKNGRIILRTGE